MSQENHGSLRGDVLKNQSEESKMQDETLRGLGENIKVGYVAIMGRPNVGKSTFLNTLLGKSLLAVSPKPQTTRNRIACVINRPGAQIIFLDTPGLHVPQDVLGEYMVRVARETLEMDVDIILWMMTPEEFLGDGLEFIESVLEEIPQKKRKALKEKLFIVVNKIDTAEDRGALREKAQQVPNKVLFISALTGEGIDELLETIIEMLPEGHRLFPEGVEIDRPESFIVAETIREAIIHLTRQEVPYSVAVDVEEYVPKENGVVYVRAVIYVERDGQKGIIIGEGGKMIKKIGQMARQKLESIFGTRFYLDLWVKVKPKWRKNYSYLRQLGYTETKLKSN